MEYKTINDLLGKADTMAIHKLILKLAPRIAFFFYWIFDTLIVLAKIKVLPNLDLKWLTHKWASCWTFANFTGIADAVVELIDVNNAEVQLVAQKRNLQSKVGQSDG